eukprot:CAMPEP_0169234766 /NCGR_PEP_ID=MMETSP1016-20121227/28350_1 /TAXON_ID=342587 /ORGANISM="Karlodinium micrum, Strain CCMP2283" /LENGTH=671 /DNA_ID=CAMNT_0009314249 /DNA_START=39 /DNA_END=2052 /DNA_ORIENTATION=+
MTEGPLALEGLKKLEAAQQELFDAFSACYSKVNGRDVESLQPHEMIMLCNDACFCDLIEKIREEIEQLSGEKTDEISDINGVIDLAQARGLHMDMGASDLKELLVEPIHRTTLLGELLADLQASRLSARRIYVSELSLVLTDEAEKQARPLIEEMGQAFDIKVGGGKGGAYAGKGGKGGKSRSGGDGDATVQALEQIAEAVAADTKLCESWPEHLLYPECNWSPTQESAINKIIDVFNKEYSTRKKVLTRRLDVTIQAFLWSPMADKNMVQMSQAIATVMEWRDRLSAASIGLWNLLSADWASCGDRGKVTSESLASPVKIIVIGAVPDRGGVPEGYTVEDITKDVVKANVSLQAKDLGRGKGGAAQAAAALASKKWVGRGMGAGDDRSSGGGGETSKGGGFYQKGGGGKGGKGSGEGGGQSVNSSGGGGYYNQSDSKGGGGGYYNQSNSKGGEGGGGGGYYGNQSGGKEGSSGGGFYNQSDSKGGGGGGFYNKKGEQGKSEKGAGERSKGDGKDRGGKTSGGGSGGFYAQQQQDSGNSSGGGFYAQQSAGGGGGFYSQQSTGSGGFYSQQSTGGGGFYSQQSTPSGGFYAQQQQEDTSGGGFYAQQQQQDQGGGGFYGQQSQGGGFYAQQGGGGGFYDQSGGGGFYAQGGGGGSGFGGRAADRPPTSKGW